MLVIAAEVDPLTEHLVLLIVAVASAGVVLLIVLLAMLFWGNVRGDRAASDREPKRTEGTESRQNPFGVGGTISSGDAATSSSSSGDCERSAK